MADAVAGSVDAAVVEDPGEQPRVFVNHISRPEQRVIDKQFHDRTLIILHGIFRGATDHKVFAVPVRIHLTRPGVRTDSS